jgi:signal transduction histidine kinase
MEIAARSQEAELAILSHNRLAQLHEMNGRYDLAEESIRHALGLSERIDERRYISDSLCQIGRIAILRGDARSALTYLHRGLALIDDTTPTEATEAYYMHLSEAYKLLGDYRRALQYHERYHDVRSTMINEESVRKIRNLQIVHEVEQIRKESELHRRHNVELAEANRRLSSANTLKSEILGITAHDLRNPLLGIRMHMEHLLSGSAVRSDPAEHFLLIHRSINEMLGAIQNQLNLAAIESGETSLQRMPVDLSTLVADVIESNRVQIERKGQRVELDAESSVRTTGESARLRDIVANLLTNAMKYSPRNTVIGAVVRRCGEMCRISISDQGPGIVEEERPELFKRFRRLSNRPTEGESSSGLGLWITKQLVEMHGGSIRLEAETTTGSRFVVELPAAASLEDVEHKRGV